MEDRKQAADACTQGHALDDLELIAAIDGEASSEVMAHLRACHACAARAQHFAGLQGLLRRRFFRMFCPSTDDLVAFHHGMPPGEQHTSIAAHVADCPHCYRELSLLKQIATDALAGRAPPVFGSEYADLHDEVRELPAEEALVGLRQVIAAAPLGHSLGEAPNGSRVARGASEFAQYAYQAENLQITIDVQPAFDRSDRRTLTGVLFLDNDLPPGGCQASAHSARDNQLIQTAELDKLGYFVFPNMLPGVYRLFLRLPDREVVIEAINL
jgi:hypothetical protein